MKKEIFDFSAPDGMSLAACAWIPEAPRGILQLSHGMTEHMERYEDFARELARCGIITAGFDLRGHGKNPGDPRCASFGQGGWEKSIEDMESFYRLTEEKYGELPHAMLGFSLGSFLLREYLNSDAPKPCGAIIMGSGTQPGAVLTMLIKLVEGQIKKTGFDSSNPMVRQLSFETYNKSFQPNRTAFDWLCSDETELDAYIADPLCRKDISAGLFCQMLGAMRRTGDKNAYRCWGKDMPVLLLSGEDDPVGSMGKGVKKLMEAMKKAGLPNLKLKLIPGARHDLLHECKNGGAAEAAKIIEAFLIKTMKLG